MRLGMLMMAFFALFATNARAALDPAQFAVGPEQRVAHFKGSLDTAGQIAAVDLVQGQAGTMGGACVAPLCEEGTLQVTGASGGRLHVGAGAGPDANNVSLEVVAPDGTAVYAGSGYGMAVTRSRHLVIDAPADGAYTVRVAGEGSAASAGKMDFAGGAWIEYPGQSSLSGDAALDQLACPLLKQFPHAPLPAAPAGAAVNDPLFAQQWGLPQIKAPAAWKRGFTGKGVTIAVIDTGIDHAHPDFAGRILPGVDTTSAESPDCGPGPMDDEGHGTATASLAAAGTNDGAGIAGVAYEASILPIKVVDANGFYFNEPLIKGMRYAIDHGADVINLSLGGKETDSAQYGPDEDPTRLNPIVKEAVDKGIAVIAAAGNDRLPVCLFPARSPGALCVGGTDRDGLPSEFSHLPNGAAPGVRAPAGGGLKDKATDCGEQIVTAWWPGSASSGCNFENPAYANGYGTSYAAPHVAGLAAMLKQAGLSGPEIVERIRMTASNKGASDPVMGYGLVDADAATAGLTPKASQQNQRVVAERVPRASRACVAARKALLRATRRAASARRHHASRRTLKRRLRERDRARRLVARKCR